MAARTFSLAEKDLFAAQLAFICLSMIETSRHRIKLRRRREVKHVLHLSHMTHLDTTQDVHPFLGSVDLIAVEVGRALFKFREIFNRAQATFRAVDLLIEEPAQADSIQPKTPFLGTNVRSQVKLSRGVPIHMAVQTGHSQARLGVLRSSVGLNSS